MAYDLLTVAVKLVIAIHKIETIKLINTSIYTNQLRFESRYDNSNFNILQMLNEHVMVRVGGGWDTLEHYITLHMSLRKKTSKSISRSVDDVRSDIKANTSLTSYTRPKRTSIGGSVGNRDQLPVGGSVGNQLLHARSSSSLNSSGSFSGFRSKLKF